MHILARTFQQRFVLLGSVITLVMVCACSTISYFTNDYACSMLDRLLRLTSCRIVWRNSDFVRDIVFSADSRTLLVTTYQDVTLWDVARATKIQTLPYTVGGNPRYSAFSPDSTRIATAGRSGVQVVARASNTLLYAIPYQSGDAEGGFAFSPDGKLLAVSEFRHNSATTVALVRVFDAQDGTYRDMIPGLQDLHLSTLVFTPDSQHLLIWAGSRHADPTAMHVWVWDLQQRRATLLPAYAVVSPDATVMLAISASGHGMDLLRLSPDNAGYIREQTLTAPCVGQAAVAFFGGGSRILTVSNAFEEEFTQPDYPTLCVVRLGDGQILWQSNAQQAQCAAVAPDGKQAAICTSGRVQLWNIPSAWYQ